MNTLQHFFQLNTLYSNRSLTPVVAHFFGHYNYSYGFQGQEKDDEIKGEGNSVNYTYRMHDTRLGRFFAIDPLTGEYPYLTPYQFSSNQPIHAMELEGLESENELGSQNPSGGNEATYSGGGVEQNLQNVGENILNLLKSNSNKHITTANVSEHYNVVHPKLRKYTPEQQERIRKSIETNGLQIDQVDILNDKHGNPMKLKYTGPKTNEKGWGLHFGLWDGGDRSVEPIDVYISVTIGNPKKNFLFQDRKIYWIADESFKVKHNQLNRRERYNARHDYHGDDPKYKDPFERPKNYVRFFYDADRGSYRNRKKEVERIRDYSRALRRKNS